MTGNRKKTKFRNIDKTFLPTHVVDPSPYVMCPGGHLRQYCEIERSV